MIMEKGISSVEVLPSKSSQVTAVKVVVKEPETKQTQREKRVGFVLVHAGAGYHSESKAKEYKHVCKRACQKAIEKLQAGALATDAVTAALIELEVRISGYFLVGEGAYRWAVDHGIPACPPGIMATRGDERFGENLEGFGDLVRKYGFSLAAFKRNKRKLELAEKVETDLIQLKKRRQSNEKENDSGTLDTVGAVVVDQEGNVAAAVSSGGLALKHPGRVETFLAGIIVEVNPKGWMDEEIMKNWLSEVYVQRLDGFFRSSPALLVYDSMRAHKTEGVKALVKKTNSELAVISAGFTKEVQPLDISVIHSFKAKLRITWENWMVEGEHSFTKTGRLCCASYATVCQWIVDAWHQVSIRTVI
ncbi:taspase 1 [Turdus rufiventris]|nr:taspase 1 [Turdus rufiventris]